MKSPRLPLADRAWRPEWMDQPNLDGKLHRDALMGLGHLNRASGICRQLWNPILQYAQTHQVSILRILDIASGGGDISLGLWKLAQKSGIELEILGLDVSKTACEYAAQLCRRAGSSISFRQADVIHDGLPSGFDVILCSLFLHHLSRANARELLQRMAAAGRLLVVNDLRRCTLGYMLAQAACRLLTLSPVVRSDGPQSVANAFSLTELRELSVSAGLAGATIRPVWPCRMMLLR